MKQIVKSVISAKSLDDGKNEASEVNKSELAAIQKDRSFLPRSSDIPVHKCGCT